MKPNLCLSIVALLLAFTASSFAGPVKVGFAERDISPDVDMERPGGYGKQFNKGTHDPCKARAAVFDDGQKRVALVGLDVCFISRDTVLKIRHAAQQQCSIEPDAILLAASHTHSGGPCGMIQPGQFDDADPMIQKLAYELSSMADAKYLARLVEQTVAAIVEADKTRVESTCGFGTGSEGRVTFNRRFRMKNGLSYTHPGQGNPDIVEPAGPIDPQVGVIGVWDKAGKLTGCVVNFACHGTTSPGGDKCSADYIYYIEQTIRGAMGKDVVVVFLNGASGDVTQVDNRSPHARPWGGEQMGRFVGGSVGAEALKVLFAMWATTDQVATASTSTLLKIPRRKPNPERVSLAYKTVSDPSAKPNYGNDWNWAKETVLLDALLKKEPVVEAEVQAIQIGPAVFVTTPAEYFCQYGLDIKAASKFPFTYPVSLANGCVGYVPTEEAFGSHGGGYETRLTAYSNLEISAGRTMADTGIALTRKLIPGPVPQPAPHAPFQAPWSYGNVGPQRD